MHAAVSVGTTPDQACGRSDIGLPKRRSAPGARVDPAAGRAQDATLIQLFTWAVVGALLLGLAGRLIVGWGPPLWLDETFTAAIAYQPTFTGLIYDCLHELGGPFYYCLMWVCEKGPGPSNLSMRLPSLIFAVAAPLLILLRGHPDRTIRWTWAALAALWIPGAPYASEARSYSLLFFMGCVQLICFRQLLVEPSRARASRWCAISALLILTHYYAGVIVALQASSYLLIHRRVAVRTWPSAIVFVPVGVWMIFHLPLHLRFSDPKVAWQALMTARDLLGVPELLLKMGLNGYVLVVAVAVSFGIDLWRRNRGIAMPYKMMDLVPVGTSLAAIAVIYGVGFLTPSFAGRYLIPFTPGILFGLALWAARVARRWQWMPLFLIVLFALSFAKDMRARTIGGADLRWGSSWEAASAYLHRQGVEHVVFLPHDSTAQAGDPSLLGDVGAFFIRRAGARVTSRGLTMVGNGPQLRAALLAAANAPGVRDKTVGTITYGRDDEDLRLSRDDKGWTCKPFSGRPFGTRVIANACYRGPLS